MNKHYQTVIRTKLHPPVKRAALVNRQRLVKELCDTQVKLTLVAAPAGFGKTTLMAQLYEETSGKVQCCWYSLDQADQDPSRFLLHFISAIQNIDAAFGKGILQVMETTLISDIADTLAELTNDLLKIEKSICLYIDDFHFSDSEQINHFIELLINLSPDNFRLVISSRLRPKLSLSTLKVRGNLVEVTASQLRFDDKEAEVFMNEIHALDLSPQQLSDLFEHSEGWAAGLQLASLSLRDTERRNEFIDSFSGNLRDIAEYLAADVLNQQSTDIRDFLLRTAILDRMNSEVCAVLTGIADSQSYLQQLEEQNLFVIPLDQERRWYRYHHLFHEFLLGQLRKNYPQEIVSLYEKATDWFNSNGYTSEAVDYSLLSGNMDKTVELVESQVEEEMKTGRMPRVNSWVDRIPDKVCHHHPKLLFAKCTALYHMNRPYEAEETINQMRECVGIDSEKLKDFIVRIEAGIAICRDDIDGMLPPLASVGLVSSNFDNGTACNIRGYALACLGDYQAATDSLLEARRYHRLNGSTFGIVYADCFLGFVDLAKGNLNKCYERFRDYMNEANRDLDTYVAPVPSIMQGIILYEWGRLDEALDLLSPNLPVIEKVGHIKLLTLGYITLAKIHAHKNKPANPTRFFDRIYKLGDSKGTPFQRLQSLIEYERIRFLVYHSRITEAIDIAVSMEIDVDQAPAVIPREWDRINCLKLMTWCRLQIASANPERALRVLGEITTLAKQAGREKRFLECKILEAGALEKLNRKSEAKSSLHAALELAVSNSYIMTFVDENVSNLLTELSAEKPFPGNPELRDYMQKIAAATNPDTSITKDRGHSQHLLEPLNSREIDILKLIAQGRSNSAIAEQLSISENTVKWHVKNIFTKLDVNKRAAAVVMAQQLQLL